MPSRTSSPDKLSSVSLRYPFCARSRQHSWSGRSETGHMRSSVRFEYCWQNSFYASISTIYCNETSTNILIYFINVKNFFMKRLFIFIQMLDQRYEPSFKIKSERFGRQIQRLQDKNLHRLFCLHVWRHESHHLIQSFSPNTPVMMMV